MWSFNFEFRLKASLKNCYFIKSLSEPHLNGCLFVWSARGIVGARKRSFREKLAVWKKQPVSAAVSLRLTPPTIPRAVVASRRLKISAPRPRGGNLSSFHLKLNFQNPILLPYLQNFTDKLTDVKFSSIICLKMFG